VVDQLNLEKKGIPTVTVVTTAFEEAIKTLLKDQGVTDMSLVVTEHPIAGHNLESIRKKADADFSLIIKTAVQKPAINKK
jgi:hypothetical protein